LLNLPGYSGGGGEHQKENAMEIVEYQGWKRNVRLASAKIELVATLEVGPRVIHLAVTGGKNLFKTYTEQMGKRGEKAWQIRGGHRRSPCRGGLS